MNIWFCSDLHIDHKSIAKYREFVTSPQHNTEIIVEDWKSKVAKCDHVYCLGDVSFTTAGLDLIGTLPGFKRLIRGNHDACQLNQYVKVFHDVCGILSYKGMWLSHAPIHPDELRGKHNVHGHVHYASLSDDRYFNCCVENIQALGKGVLISLEDIREVFSQRFPKPSTSLTDHVATIDG